jgi:pSer/pThr/pTyr-binding forkhead associated (FHA) protein
MQNQRPVAGYIVFESHPTLQDKIPLFEGENIVGRAPEKASVIIKDGQISSSHAKISITSKSIIIVDMGSKNGTFLDTDMRERIEKGKQYQISENQKLSFGEVEFHIERLPQTKIVDISPKNVKEGPSKKLNLLAEFDSLTEKESKKPKLNQKDRNDSSLDEKAVDKKTKKES